jgi:hypothetical protein
MSRVNMHTPAEEVTLDGVTALYLPHEMDAMRSVLASADAGAYAPGEAHSVIALLHGCKAMLGATILAEDDPWRERPDGPVPT